MFGRMVKPDTFGKLIRQLPMQRQFISSLSMRQTQDVFFGLHQVKTLERRAHPLVVPRRNLEQRHAPQVVQQPRRKHPSVILMFDQFRQRPRNARARLRFQPKRHVIESPRTVEHIQHRRRNYNRVRLHQTQQRHRQWNIVHFVAETVRRAVRHLQNLRRDRRILRNHLPHLGRRAVFLIDDFAHPVHGARKRRQRIDMPQHRHRHRQLQRTFQIANRIRRCPVRIVPIQTPPHVVRRTNQRLDA